MIKIFSTTLLLTSLCISSFAQFNDGFKKLPSGLDILIIKDEPGRTAQVGDMAEIHISVKVGDSLVFDTKKLPGGAAVEQPITEPQFLADLMEGFMMLSKGDVALMRANSDSMFTDGKPRPPFMKPGDFIFWQAEMVNLKSEEEIAKETEMLLAKEKQVLANYIMDNKIKGATQTASGMYIQITEEGEGEPVAEGKIASMNYTGYLLDGSVFDSNVDPKFGHEEPFEFMVGQGMVIKGWDEGVAQLKVGSKAKLIIPSGMAYGSQSRPGNELNPKGIPANSPLVFDVEVLELKERPALDTMDVNDTEYEIEDLEISDED